MSIKRLQDLCLNAVVSAIWSASNIEKEIVPMAYQAAHISKKDGYTRKEMLIQDSKFQKTSYYKLTESLMDKIMKMDINSKLSLKIALEFFHREQSYCNAILELTARLLDKNMHNITYCAAKAVFKNNEVDRCETIRQILFHSYFQVGFETKDIEEYCSINKGILNGLFEYLRSSNRLADRHETYNKVLEMTIELNGVYFVWLGDAMKVFGDALNLTYEPCPKIILEHVTIHAPKDVLDYFYDQTRGQENCEEMGTRALVSTLTYCISNNDNIIYLFENISKHSQRIIFKRFHKDIFSKLFNSSYNNYCLEVFNELVANKEFSICKNLLYQAVDLFTTMYMGLDIYASLFSEIGEETFLKMWNTTPDSVKLDLGKKFYEMLQLLIQQECYETVALMISDKVFDSQQKLEFNIYVLTTTTWYKGCSLKDLMSSFPELDISCIKGNMSSDLLKKMLLIRIDYEYDYEHLSIFFESKSSENELKRQISNDKAFVVDMLSSVALTEYGEVEVICFLNWIYEYDEQLVQQFIQEHLLSEYWLVEIIKKYLLETTNKEEYPKPSMFSKLNMTEHQANEIKTLIREDSKLMNKLCENFTRRYFCDVTRLLECLFNNLQQIEKRLFLENYLLSEQGLSRIYQSFEPNYYSERMFLSYRFYPTVTYYFEFLKFWLYGNPGLQSALTKALDRLGHPNCLKSINNFDHKVAFLPFENLHQHRVIVDANYRMFRSIIKIPSHNFCNAYSKNDEFRDCRSITSLTRFSQRFAKKWAGISIPVVL